MVNGFCAKMYELFDCPQYIEWEFDCGNGYHYGQAIECTSCQLQGQSYNIDKIAVDCPFKEKFTDREEPDERNNLSMV